jgi:hypothetical protein
LGAAYADFTLAASGDTWMVEALLTLPMNLLAGLASKTSPVIRDETGESVGVTGGGVLFAVDLARIPGVGNPDFPAEGIPEYLGFGMPGVGTWDMTCDERA